MELVLDDNIHDRFLWHSTGNFQNHGLCFLDALLVAPHGDCGFGLRGFVNIDLGTSVVLDLIDSGSSFAEDP
jgi:hypothetical protein